MKFDLTSITKDCHSEIDVQTNWKNLITQYFSCRPFRSLFSKNGIKHDGIFECPSINLKLLSEFKFNDYSKKILKRKNVIEYIIQAIYYLKKIDSIGEQIPNVIFIGDETACYIFHSDLISKYLDYNLNWEIEPCKSGKENPELYKEILNNEDIILKALETEIVRMDEIIDRIKNINKKVARKMTITESTLNRFFLEFTENVLIKSSQYDANTLKGIFIDLINNPSDNSLSEKNKNILITKNFGNVKVNGIKFEEFFSYVQDIYPPYDQNRFLEICDRLIEDHTRRFNGEFYTPTIWANEAHKMISEKISYYWKEKFNVWDSSWGTGNLTRDYIFKKLYCSTLNDSDLKIGEKYNLGSIKFQFDFLNDDFSDLNISNFDEDEKLLRYAPNLIRAFENNDLIIIMINPPYGAARGGRIDISTKGMNNSKVRLIMHQNELAASSKELINQFLFRIMLLKKKYKLTNLHIALFSSGSFLVREQYKEFRKIFFDNFEFISGFMFDGKHFDGNKSGWPVLFSLWKSGNEKNRTSFVFNVTETNQQKIIYNVDDTEHALSWARQNDKNLFIGNYDFGQTVGETKNWFQIGKNYDGSNKIYKSNYYKIISLFTAIGCTEKTYINELDYYLKPTENNTLYKQWNYDCIIYSLFNNINLVQSSRDNTNMENQFFWLPNELMKDLANKYNFPELYQDAIKFNKERFVYNELRKFKNKLSPDAIDVLNKATDLLIKSFPERVRLFDLQPDWNLESWDAGWYQIKLVLKENMKEDLNDFKELYKKFEDRMKKGIYDFGFLK
jgi:hypothetical protein